MQFHFVDYQCDDLEKIRSIHSLDAALYEYFNFVFKRTYHVASMRKTAGMDETPTALRPGVQRLKIKWSDGVMRVQTLVKAKMQTLEEMGCFSRDIEPAVVRTLWKQSLRYGA